MKHYYVQLPSSFWTRGWICVLSGPAVAMYLALLHELRGAEDPAPVWFSPAVADSRYGLSEDTRSRGLRELTRAGLIDTKRRPVGTGAFDDNRYRNVYTLNPKKLEEHASVPTPSPRDRNSAAF
jgi:DNA-binding transcriptional ArsR family regulator